jgi:hypothetical protein
MPILLNSVVSVYASTLLDLKALGTSGRKSQSASIDN